MFNWWKNFSFTKTLRTMGKSRRKVAGGTWCCCKSQKKGKQISSRRFRHHTNQLVRTCQFDGLPFRSYKPTSPWDLGGDGKWAIFRIKVDWDEDYLRWLRK